MSWMSSWPGSSRGGLGTEEHGARGDVLGLDLAGLDVGVGGDDGQDLQGLALVLVQALNHGVEHGVRVELEAVLALGVGGEVDLVGLLDGGELLDEFIVLGQRLEALEHLQVGEPLVGAEASVMRSDRRGLASLTKRRGVTPLVTLVNLSG